MKHSLLETTIGAVILLAAAFFLVFSYSTAYRSAGTLTDGSYRLQAAFDNISGLKIGDAVMISGVKVGTIDDIRLDDKLYRAVVDFNVTGSVALATDSSARIASESLLGGKYLDVQPGGDDANLKDGGKIVLTQGASNLEDLLGRFIFNANADKKPAGTPDGGRDDAGPDALPAYP